MTHAPDGLQPSLPDPLPAAPLPGPTYPPPVPAAAHPGPPASVSAVSVMLYILSGLTILTAVVLAAASALAGKAVDLPLVGDDAEHLMLVGFGGVALLALLAAVDIVLGVYVWKGRRWAKRGVLLTGGLVVVALFAAGAAPVAVLGLAVTALFDLLLLGPGPARTFFRGQGA